MKHVVNIMIIVLVVLLPFAKKLLPMSANTGVITELSEMRNDPLPHRLAKVVTSEGTIEAMAYESNIKYGLGDEIIVQKDPQFENLFILSDKVRTTALIQLFMLFLIVILLVSGEAGIRSLLGLIFSFGVIFKFLLPQIVAGYNPVYSALGASAMILLVSYYLTHGLNRKTTIAILGTLAALLITGLLASMFAGASALSGLGAEETAFLLDRFPIGNFYNLLLASIIIGSLGVLDDITISQSSIVSELSLANRKLSKYELYVRAMRIGHDHISSLVNTLVLVYAGSALPLLLLFVTSDASTMQLLNYEAVAEEVVRTLVGSIGLITAVPLTTAIAAFYFGKEK